MHASLRLGGRRVLRWAAVGPLVPQVVGFVAFGSAWLMGLAPSAPPSGR